MTTYRIVRFYREHPEGINRTRLLGIYHRGLTLEEAREHCKDPNTSSSTAQSKEAQRHTELYGDWFDGYEEE